MNYNNMKNFLFGFIAVVLSTVTYGQDFDKILKDAEFQEYLKELSKEQSYPMDYKKIKEYNADGKIDETELKDLHEILGYKSQDDFLSSLVSQNKKLESLEKKYGLSKYSQEQLISLVDQGFTSLELPLYSGIEYQPSGSNCNRRRNNCFIVATATGIGAHIACGGMDLTVVLGILCHGAATALGYAMADDCNLDYVDCMSK